MTSQTHRLERELEGVRSVADAIRWASAREPRATFLTAVEQDEFTFDVVVRVDPRTYVVFDTT